MTNAYGIPGLTDFGIASRISDTDSIGLSIPWAAPELIARTAPPSIESDVYALAATLWQALTGRVPHAREGDNSPTAMMLRIRTQAAEPTGRPDVPAALDQILLAGLNPDATNRPFQRARVDHLPPARRARPRPHAHRRPAGLRGVGSPAGARPGPGRPRRHDPDAPGEEVPRGVAAETDRCRLGRESQPGGTARRQRRASPSAGALPSARASPSAGALPSEQG